MRLTEVQFVPGVSSLPRDHSALRLAEQELRADLRDAGVDARERRTEAADTKGWQTDLVLSLSGPAAVAGAVKVFQAWLGRDRRRSLTVVRTVRESGSTEVTISGDAVSDETIRAALGEAMEQAAPEDSDPEK